MFTIGSSSEVSLSLLNKCLQGILRKRSIFYATLFTTTLLNP